MIHHQFLIGTVVYLICGVFITREFCRLRKPPNILGPIITTIIWFPIMLVWVYRGLKAEWKQP